MEIKPFKIRVTPEQSEIVQKTLFANGGKWPGGDTDIIYGKCFLYFSSESNNIITWSDETDVKFFNDHELSELTFEQFTNLYIKPMNKKIIGYKLIKKYPLCVLEIGDEIPNESYAEQFPEFWEPVYETEYVPFTMDDYELFMGKTVKNTELNIIGLIHGAQENRMWYCGGYQANFDYALKHIVFADGTPFGKRI